MEPTEARTPVLPAATPAQAAPAAALPAGAHCLRCDYDLSGSAADGVCPECGAPAADALATFGLAPASLRLAARGALALLLIPQGLFILGVIALAVGTDRWDGAAPAVPGLLLIAASASVAAVAVRRVARVTAGADVHPVRGASPRRPRLGGTMAPLTLGALASAAVAVAVVLSTMSGPRRGLIGFVVACGVLTAGLHWGRNAVLAKHLAWLAGRARRPRTRRALVTCRWLAVAVGAVACVLGLFVLAVVLSDSLLDRRMGTMRMAELAVAAVYVVGLGGIAAWSLLFPACVVALRRGISGADAATDQRQKPHAPGPPEAGAA